MISSAPGIQLRAVSCCFVFVFVLQMLTISSVFQDFKKLGKFFFDTMMLIAISF